MPRFKWSFPRWRHTWTLGLAMGIAAVTARAQSDEFAAIDQELIEVYLPSSVTRIGSFVLGRFMTRLGDFASAHQILVSCDGRWLSEALNFTLLPPGLAVDDWEQLARTYDQSVPLKPVRLLPPDPFHSALDQEAIGASRTLCSTAHPEQKGIQIPLAFVPGHSPDDGQILSLLSGTARRRGDVVDVWVAHSPVRLTRILADAESPGRQGIDAATTGLTWTGRQFKARYQVDCAKRSFRPKRRFAAWYRKTPHASSRTGQLIASLCRLYVP